MTVLIALSAVSASLGEVVSEIGPRSPYGTNNTNRFDSSLARPGQAASDCRPARYEAERGRPPCPSDMAWVCSRKYGASFCADRELAAGQAGLPAGNFSRSSCEDFCRARGRRLLTNNEWLVACTGTPAEVCLIYSGEWPPAHFAKTPRHPCAAQGTGSAGCMSDARLTWLMPPTPGGCVSEAGVRGCVGTLGQWVSDDVPGTRRGRFNGGLFPQRASSVLYTTTAHSPAYSDYSIGCRCGSDTE